MININGQIYRPNAQMTFVCQDGVLSVTSSWDGGGLSVSFVASITCPPDGKDHRHGGSGIVIG